MSSGKCRPFYLGLNVLNESRVSTSFKIPILPSPMSYGVSIYFADFWEKSTAQLYVKIKLTHWGRVMHICVRDLTNIGSDNGLSPGRRQAIIWTNAGILLIGPWGTNCSEILIDIHTFSFKRINFKMSSAKWRPFCLGLNVLIKAWSDVL